LQPFIKKIRLTVPILKKGEGDGLPNALNVYPATQKSYHPEIKYTRVTWRPSIPGFNLSCETGEGFPLGYSEGRFLARIAVFSF